MVIIALVVAFFLVGCTRAPQYHPTLICLPGVIHGMQSIVCVDQRTFDNKAP